METRANYVLIGAFTLLAIFGALGFFIWLASVQIDRQYAVYGILFDDVTGLDASGDVLFNGVPVGRVIALGIDETDPSKVLTTVEINAATPVNGNTVAQLQSQGVTGVAYISLSGFAADGPALEPTRDGLMMIPSRRSTVQTLVEDAPDLIAEATRLLQQFQDLTGPENQALVTNILRNLDVSSGQLDQALADFSSITGTVSEATDQITLFTSRLDSISATAQNTLETADAALGSAQGAFDSADRALSTSTSAIESAGGAFRQAEEIMQTQVPDIIAQISQSVSSLNSAITGIQGQTEGALDGFSQTTQVLNTRLAELEQTLAEANTAFDAVTQASGSIETLVEGDATLLVAETRDVLAAAQASLTKIETLVVDAAPEIMDDVRTAAATAATAVDQVARDLTGVTGQLDPLAGDVRQAVENANALFARAQSSLEILDGAMGGAQTALTSAETAFDAATGVMQTDLTPVLGDIRRASEQISVAVQDVTRDVPQIAADLRALVARTDAVVAQVQATVAASAPGVSSFADTGLADLSRLSTEARNLVSTLNDLVRRIDRDPTRFLLDDRVPDYRR